MSDGLFIDLSRLKHKQSVRATYIKIEVAKAEEAQDVEKLQALQAEMDAMIAAIVTSVPDDWLPDGVTLNDPHWVGEISQMHYNAILREMRGEIPGEKKA